MATGDAPARTKRTVGDRPWWQTCNVGEFRERIGPLSDEEIHELGAEIKGSIAVTQGQIEARKLDPRGEDDVVWRSKARLALGFMAEKSSVLKVEMHRRNVERVGVQKEARARLIETARARLAADDVRGAVAALIDFLGPRNASPDDER